VGSPERSLQSSAAAAASALSQQLAGIECFRMQGSTVSAVAGHEHRLTAAAEAMSAVKSLGLAFSAAAAALPLAQKDVTAPGQHGARLETESRRSG
jgi:hypothetical protein